MTLPDGFIQNFLANFDKKKEVLKQRVQLQIDSDNKSTKILMDWKMNIYGGLVKIVQMSPAPPVFNTVESVRLHLS